MLCDGTPSPALISGRARLGQRARRRVINCPIECLPHWGSPEPITDGPPIIAGTLPTFGVDQHAVSHRDRGEHFRHLVARQRDNGGAIEIVGHCLQAA